MVAATMSEPTITRRQWWQAGLLALALVGLSVYVHLVWNSMLIHSDAIWVKRIALHHGMYPFSIRIFTTFTTELVAWLTGLSTRWAFSVHQFALMWLLGLVMYWYLRGLRLAHAYAVAGIVMLLSAYPVMCAFFEPVYTWDDLWQYAFLAAAFGALLRSRSVLGAVLMCLALAARETTGSYLPAYVLLAMTVPVNGNRRAALLMGPVLFLLLYMVLFYQFHYANELGRFKTNFGNPAAAANTLYSLVVSNGYLWVTGLLALVISGRRLLSDRLERFLVVGAMVAIPFALVGTTLMTLARETRLFFGPALFLIPLTLILWRELEPDIRFFLRHFRWVAAVSITGLAGYAGYRFVSAVIPRFDFRPVPEFHHVYFGIQVALAVAIGGLVTLGLARQLRASDRARSVS